MRSTLPTENWAASSPLSGAGSQPAPMTPAGELLRAFGLTNHAAPHDEFTPLEPTSLEQTGLREVEIEALALKFLLNCTVASGQEIAKQICLPLGLLTELLRRMKSEQLVVYRRSVGLHDYEYELTSQGYERASLYFERGTYFGAAPVSLEAYAASVKAQSPSRDNPSADHLRKALADLVVDPEIFSQLGQAISSVGAIFLYGAPGNGKTSMAERLTDSFGQTIWIPRALNIEGLVVRVFDPIMHVEIKQDETQSGSRHDQRWVKIKRPTVVVGGELTLESLELRSDKSTGVLEAPVHLKSNCGTLVVDDFGRQRVSTSDLLNRWIVPLEKHYDYLNTPSGKKIQVPFDQLTVFATNLDPQALVDEAFLRRIPYKIRVLDPPEDVFRKLFEALAPKFGMAFCGRSFEHLVETHYKRASRSMRYCHARDLLQQVQNLCRFRGERPALSPEAFDIVAKNYFTAM